MKAHSPTRMLLCAALLLAILVAISARQGRQESEGPPTDVAPGWTGIEGGDQPETRLSIQLWLLRPPYVRPSQEAAVAELLRAQNAPNRPEGLFEYPLTISTVPVDGCVVTPESVSAATLLTPEEYLTGVVQRPPAGT